MLLFTRQRIQKLQEWFGALYFLPRNKLLPELIMKDGKRTPLTVISKIEGLMDLVKESFIMQHPNPTVIYNGTHNIPNLDKLFITPKHKKILQENQIDFFFFEVLTHYVPNNTGVEEPHIMKIDNEPEKVSKIRCYELDTLDKWAAENNINLHVHCTDHKSWEYYKTIYKNITLKSMDLFVSWYSSRFLLQETYNRKGLYPGDIYPPIETKKIHKKFWSGAWRYDPSRHFIMAHLASQGLTFNNEVSFYFKISNEEMANRMWFDWRDFSRRHPILAEKLLRGNDLLQKQVPLHFEVDNPKLCTSSGDPEWNTGPQSNQRRTQDPVDSYEKCFCAIIQESRVTQPWPNISEKSLNAIKALRPFVMCAAPGTLSMLREMGFITFSDFWPEDYDEITSNADRLARITEVIEEINQYDIKQMKKMYKRMLPILLHNYHQIEKLSKFYNKLNKKLSK